MGTECRLLIGLVEIAVFHAVFRRESGITGSAGERDATIAAANFTIRKMYLVGRIEAELLRHGFAQLDAGCVDARRRTVRAPLAARTRRRWKRGIAQLDDNLVERDAHHFCGGLRDNRIAAGADVGHVGFNGDDAFRIKPHARARFHIHVVAKSCSHTDADEPAAIADLGRYRIATVPAELLRA